MNVPAHFVPFWKSYVATQKTDPTPRFYEAFHFDDHESSANELGELVLRGTKRATAGLVWVFEHDGKPLPRVSDLSVVTNWAKKPLCVIETVQIDIVPYEEVSEEFAATEGEGDGSLRFWREAHWAYFGRECKRIGRVPEVRMPVTCERFAVVYRGGDEVS
jgi:uncharacterized protein YhfF